MQYVATTIALFTLAFADVDRALDNPQADPLVGVWRFATTDGESEVSGTVSVWRLKDSYAVIWSGASATESSLSVVMTKGHGMRQGNTFAITWVSGNGHGLSVFTVDEKGKRLTGRWTPAGSGTAREEVWTWVGKHGKGA